ncbi:MAG: aminodeoxychorismate/anthranilate synthase component II [Spirochaetales bacterium]|nr:aminodeoxychorismate/anthranilate synthase component II [Spirochaetales bacterium]
MPRKILLIDNYDSFTHNLLHLLHQVRPSCSYTLMRNRDERIFQTNWDGVIVSPGPGTPEETGLLRDFFREVVEKRSLPYFGICLGMQFLAHYYGLPIGKVEPRHGRTCPLNHRDKGIFKGLAQDFFVMRYNSLGLEEDSTELIHSPLEVLASEKGSPLVMALAHKSQPFLGVQFHPESFLTEQSIELMSRFFEVYID